eukprot:CAMPEP_0203921708 /NCGR_PEP_ID=MMETSP0359-20131031/61826_1 /ASSEMBLY_ACC=CAM_ASM_000338 /TAXON_ID=268821 /ORGANISM="Scrippsiella Hangoei, Strain SHTV-5" /LENGTH=483 /DNA_ID=CAMNT_0050849441 /DNA_START=1 /DNA_END=1452 /DNA_ORIENTATION=+
MARRLIGAPFARRGVPHGRRNWHDFASLAAIIIVSAASLIGACMDLCSAFLHLRAWSGGGASRGCSRTIAVRSVARPPCAAPSPQPRPRHIVRHPRGSHTLLPRRTTLLQAAAVESTAVAAASAGAAGEVAAPGLTTSSPRQSFEERMLQQQDRARELPRQDRPRYVGCTESADVRESVVRSLLRTWPAGSGVDEFWTVAGGLSGLDSLAALQGAQVPVARLVIFDRDPLQLSYGELVLTLIGLFENRDAFVAALFGRSMKAWGRLIGASNMLDFLDVPIDERIEPRVLEMLPSHLRDVYTAAFACAARREGWPLVWPSFGYKEKLPLRRLPNAKRRLGGGRNEALHINEAGWLKDEISYERARQALAGIKVEFRSLELGDLRSPAVARRVVFISNIDGSPQFMNEQALGRLRLELSGGTGIQSEPDRAGFRDSSAPDEGARGTREGQPGTLLLSTRRAEWLPWGMMGASLGVEKEEQEQYEE